VPGSWHCGRAVNAPDSGFSRLTLAKVGFAVAGIGTFGVGVRVDDSRVRWVGVALVAIAWFLRFAGPRSTRHGRPGDDSNQLPDETR
jgi:hypothetical protein